MSARDTFVQLGFVMIAVGASFATWALLTGPLQRWTKLPGAKPQRRTTKQSKPPTSEPEDGPRT